MPSVVFGRFSWNLVFYLELVQLVLDVVSLTDALHLVDLDVGRV